MTTARTPGRTGAAQRLAALAEDALGAPVVVVRSRRAMWAAARDQSPHAPRLSAADGTRAIAEAVRLGAVGPRLPAPTTQARLRGGLHSKARDRAVYVPEQVFGLLETVGLEVRPVESMRAHYVRIIDAWSRTLEERWEEFVLLTVRPKARGDSGLTGAEAASRYRHLEGR
ncbi:hypothetical protein [Streptomyces sp. NBC_01435]|uniref:hypothetical protein n=1 Tax=Streptomyces sp. NBC_01435 TaxID=2903865 RepID=UPI002E36C3D6|nr:hypothetical protein [Streptomyces sp. NBC_01435]